MKRFIPVALLFVVCVFMLLSCGLSATQIENNLKQDETTELCEWAKSRYKGKFRTYVTRTLTPDYTKKKVSLGWRNPFVLSDEEIANADEKERE